MEALGAAGVIVGLAVPVFHCVKTLRDKIKLVRLFILFTLVALII